MDLKCLGVITSKKEAQLFFKEYCDALMESFSRKGKEITMEKAMHIAKYNIGLFGGNFNINARARIEELFNTKHPFVGAVRNNSDVSTVELVCCTQHQVSLEDYRKDSKLYPFVQDVYRTSKPKT